MAGRKAEQGGLLGDLRKQVALLEEDLRSRSEEPEFRFPLDREYREAREAGRTAAAYESWRDERVTQVAVAWVLGTLFVRFCEDNELIEHPWIAGPGDRLELAEARHDGFFRDNPELNDCDWLIAAFTHLADCHPTVAGLFDRKYNPLWQITPGYEAASALLSFWRRRGPNGELVHVFEDRENLDTRFLGDLYQDLSEHARKTYALLQTPDFVEEFILDLTLNPAIEEFGLEPELEVKNAAGEVVWHHRGLRTIDPTCGSGHFLIGLFTRLLEKHREAAGPETDDWELIRKALNSVHGCDKNPFAASIARFRLLIAVLKEAGVRHLNQAPEFPIHVAVGDSLLHGRGSESVTGDLFSPEKETFAYSTEDVWDYSKRVDLLGINSYHAVVGNPPYITVKDKQENQNYRDSYKDVCSGKYALSVPFAKRFFQLAVGRDDRRTAGSGFVGQITANSFMKREFGKKLIEDYFHSKVNLTHVIDTSGAYIPGHGTPTVILVGRNSLWSPGSTVRAVLGIRGEPTQPGNPAKGMVWQAIVKQIDQPGSESEWVSVTDLDREALRHHPWSLSGGGAANLFSLLEENRKRKLGQTTPLIGVFGMTNADDVMLAPKESWLRKTGKSDWAKRIVLGDEIRDWSLANGLESFFPYDQNGKLLPLEKVNFIKWMWPTRTLIGNRATFSKKTYFEEGRPWYQWHQVTWRSDAHHFYITFAFVATHNHFVLDRGGKVFNRSAPVIKLPKDATEDQHLELLGVLNSSTACFWLKQVSHNKGSTVDSKGARQTTIPWEDFYEFTGTKLQEFPLPVSLPLECARELDSLAQRLSVLEPSSVIESATPTRARLNEVRAEYAAVRSRMIALQEELDWDVYHRYGLLNDAEHAELVLSDTADVPDIKLGERAFEIVLARRIKAGEATSEWFNRHGSTPITEIPSHWPDAYKKIVARRIEVIESRKDIALLERPEHKRRWQSEPWEKKEKAALESWLLDRCEDRALWFRDRDGLADVPCAMTLAELADALVRGAGGAEVASVAELYATDHLGRPDARLVEVLEKITADQHVPYLAALRYKPSGLRKREQWEEVWDLQREEDALNADLAEGEKEKRLDIPVPPKYTSADFRKPSYWANRGKLDVPKERFVSYPGAGPSSDPTLVVGWAGWNHQQQAEALMRLVEDRVERDNWTGEQLTPLLAGIRELLPWVQQWHGDYDPDWDGSPAEQIAQWLADQQERHRLTDDDLSDWRP
ncbi:BREX-2 system adenine-specific DNA-methyltransferase PglX [Thermobifida halotolerans]|uniref:BREX-2 system adenine-specific DNA-methyltransferase PglX n=1 Tax=Thermobifida halotolerans TaxID=483545 RepID=UPI000838A5E2|nr:BREX-2 system adenine-specific DNA-methyltransferase PglX [Thermobifida halotolerans]